MPSPGPFVYWKTCRSGLQDSSHYSIQAFSDGCVSSDCRQPFHTLPSAAATKELGGQNHQKATVEGVIADVTMRLSLQHTIAGLEMREVSQRSVGMCCATYHDAPRDDPTSQWPDPLTEEGTLTVVGRRHPCRTCFQLRLVAHPGGLAVQPPHLRENSDGGK